MSIKKPEPGPKNALTDITGLKVGQAEDEMARTGVTVIVCDTPLRAAVDVRGGGPGTRETDALAPHNLAPLVDALVLTGGSVYGLGAADGVCAALGAQGRGFGVYRQTGIPFSPIVPAAVLYDLANGGAKTWGDAPPYRALGMKALQNAGTDFALGSAGAAYGAQAGALAGGIGSASTVSADGLEVGALAAVNSFGSVLVPGTRQFWAAPFEVNGEFGDLGWPQDIKDIAGDWGAAKTDPAQRQNTTLGVVATSTPLTAGQAKRLAIMAQDGLARAIRPAHTPFDGDIVFALCPDAGSTTAPDEFTLARLGNLAADCLARAIARGVFETTECGNAPPWREYKPG